MNKLDDHADDSDHPLHLS